MFVLLLELETHVEYLPLGRSYQLFTLFSLISSMANVCSLPSCGMMSD